VEKDKENLNSAENRVGFNASEKATAVYKDTGWKDKTYLFIKLDPANKEDAATSCTPWQKFLPRLRNWHCSLEIYGNKSRFVKGPGPLFKGYPARQENAPSERW
jgi:hypothetical protein